MHLNKPVFGVILLLCLSIQPGLASPLKNESSRRTDRVDMCANLLSVFELAMQEATDNKIAILETSVVKRLPPAKELIQAFTFLQKARDNGKSIEEVLQIAGTSCLHETN